MLCSGRPGDEATGTTAMREWYTRLGRGAYTVELPPYWSRLGVERKGNSVALDDAAPLAALRNAIAGATPLP